MSLSPGQLHVLRALGEGQSLLHVSYQDRWWFTTTGKRVNKRDTRPLVNQQLIEREVGGWHQLTDKGRAALRAHEQEEHHD